MRVFTPSLPCCSRAEERVWSVCKGVTVLCYWSGPDIWTCAFEVRTMQGKWPTRPLVRWLPACGGLSEVEVAGVRYWDGGRDQVHCLCTAHQMLTFVCISEHIFGGKYHVCWWTWICGWLNSIKSSPSACLHQIKGLTPHNNLAGVYSGKTWKIYSCLLSENGLIQDC